MMRLDHRCTRGENGCRLAVRLPHWEEESPAFAAMNAFYERLFCAMGRLPSSFTSLLCDCDVTEVQGLIGVNLTLTAFVAGAVAAYFPLCQVWDAGTGLLLPVGDAPIGKKAKRHLRRAVKAGGQWCISDEGVTILTVRMDKTTLSSLRRSRLGEAIAAEILPFGGL